MTSGQLSEVTGTAAPCTARAASEATKTITFALGDIFHSNPLVVGSPSNTRYFADNTATEGKTCAAGDKGYRCFFAKHEKRRKLLVMGSNDGMVPWSTWPRRPPSAR